MGTGGQGEEGRKWAKKRDGGKEEEKRMELI
jgi:hypothetical protein